MRIDLIHNQQLLCPRCLNEDASLPDVVLTLENEQLEPQAGDTPAEVISGTLGCPRCEQSYEISDGVGYFTTPATESSSKVDMGIGRYRNEAFARAYIQTHFRDAIANNFATRSIIEAHDATGFYTSLPEDSYYPQLAQLLDEWLRPSALVLDLGCSVGRLSHELARKSRVVIGADSAELHVRIARRIMRDHTIHFRPAEPTVSDSFSGGPELSLDVSSIVRSNVEFIVADENTMPFRAFDIIACAAVIDRVPNAELFLRRLGRFTRDGSILLLTTPFDWDDKFVEVNNRLGFGAFDTSSGRAEDALEQLARRLNLRVLHREELRWVTYKDRRYHYVWSVYCGIFRVDGRIAQV